MEINEIRQLQGQRHGGNVHADNTASPRKRSNDLRQDVIVLLNNDLMVHALTTHCAEFQIIENQQCDSISAELEHAWLVQVGPVG